MIEGILVYNEIEKRYQVRYGLEEYSDCLHCGDCLEVLIGETWKQTRMESNNDWYLVGIPRNISLQGLKARIS